MTEQERLAAFKAEFEGLMKKYGVSIGVNLIPRPLGPVVQVEAQTDFVLLPGWMPPIEPPPVDPELLKKIVGERITYEPDPAFVNNALNGHKD